MGQCPAPQRRNLVAPLRALEAELVHPLAKVHSPRLVRAAPRHAVVVQHKYHPLNATSLDEVHGARVQPPKSPLQRLVAPFDLLPDVHVCLYAQPANDDAYTDTRNARLWQNACTSFSRIAAAPLGKPVTSEAGLRMCPSAWPNAPSPMVKNTPGIFRMISYRPAWSAICESHHAPGALNATNTILPVGACTISACVPVKQLYPVARGRRA